MLVIVGGLLPEELCLLDQTAGFPVLGAGFRATCCLAGISGSSEVCAASEGDAECKGGTPAGATPRWLPFLLGILLPLLSRP